MSHAVVTCRVLSQGAKSTMLKYGDNPLKQRVRNLQHTLEHVLAQPGLEIRRRKQLVSSIRTFGRVVGRPPGSIEENIISIRAEMAKANPARASIKPNTW